MAFKNEVIDVGAFNNKKRNTALLCSWHFRHLSKKTKATLFRLITFVFLIIIELPGSFNCYMFLFITLLKKINEWFVII